MEEGVTGLPPGMVGRREELTPMLSQYAELCVAYEEALVLFQVGDFYEAFCEAAEAVSRELEITLTKREDSTGTYPMAGIPIDNASSYIERLLEAGYRVAIADQVQDPAESTGPVDRAVTRILTPGTVIDDELLEPGSSNYVACLASDDEGAGGEDGDVAAADGDEAGRSQSPDSGRYAVAFADVSTGDFLVTSADRETIADELERFDPAEVLVAPEIDPEEVAVGEAVTPPTEGTFEHDGAVDRIAAAGDSPDDLDHPSEARACGALLAYVEYTRGDVGERAARTALSDAEAGETDNNGSDNGAGNDSGDGDDGSDADIQRSRLGAISRYEPADHLRLDGTALRSLEVFAARDGGDDHTLFSVLDETSCALGRRRLAGWLRRPLIDAEAIGTRHDAVSELVERSLSREDLRGRLRDVYDLSRLSTRVGRGRANARDLRSLADTVAVVPEIRETLAECESAVLRDLRDRLDGLGDVRGFIDRAIRPDPPMEITDGGLVKSAFDEQLRSLRETERSGREWVAELEARERSRTGIDSLSVGYNQVHGYYIEVTNPNLDAVPDTYTRRQTLKNAERFYTPDLKRREDEIVSAGERADGREYELFREVRATVGAEADRIDRVADALADLDALCTLAAVAVERDYVRPAVGGDDIDIAGARHPVVEAVQAEFVPNHVSLHPGEVVVLTGPNMSGKSTYMRAVALCVLLCQIGSFVPAREARLPVVDRVFTRVGASDDIAGGQSTFMREMTELATVLDEATDRSLVVLDEVGRGTSSADGRAIARAAVERLHDSVGARTLFATHYHELTDLAHGFDRVSNYHFAADRADEEVTFLHSVAEGASSASYGIDVARLAGVPDAVVERSRALVAGDGGGDGDSRAGSRPAGNTSDEAGDPGSPAGRIEDVASANGHRSIDETGDADGAIAGETAIQARNGTTSEDERRRSANELLGATERNRGVSDERTEGVQDESAGIEALVRNIDVANTTPVEALCTLNELKSRLNDRADERHGAE